MGDRAALANLRRAIVDLAGRAERTPAAAADWRDESDAGRTVTDATAGFLLNRSQLNVDKLRS